MCLHSAIIRGAGVGCRAHGVLKLRVKQEEGAPSRSKTVACPTLLFPHLLGLPHPVPLPAVPTGTQSCPAPKQVLTDSGAYGHPHTDPVTLSPRLPVQAPLGCRYQEGLCSAVTRLLSPAWPQAPSHPPADLQWGETVTALLPVGKRAHNQKPGRGPRDVT